MYAAVVFCSLLIPHLGDVYFPFSDHPTVPHGEQCGKRRTDISPIQLQVVGGEEVSRGFSPWSTLLGYRV